MFAIGPEIDFLIGIEVVKINCSGVVQNEQNGNPNLGWISDPELVVIGFS